LIIEEGEREKEEEKQPAHRWFREVSAQELSR